MSEEKCGSLAQLLVEECAHRDMGSNAAPEMFTTIVIGMNVIYSIVSVHGKKKCPAGHMDQLFWKAAGPKQKLPVHTLDHMLSITGP